MKVRIEIDTRTFVRFWLVVIGFALALFVLYSAWTALVIVAAAFFLALALSGPVNMIASRLPGKQKNRIAATAIAYLLVVGVIGGTLVLAVPPVIEQTARFAQTVPDLADTATTQWRGLEEVIRQYNLQPQVDGAVRQVKDNAAGWASNAGQTILSSLGSVFSALAATFLVLILSFLMLVEGPVWLQRFWKLYTDRETMEYQRGIAERMYHVVNGYVVGQLSVSAVGGVASGLSVFLLSFWFNVPSNLAIPAAVIAFLLSLIPMFGSTIGGVLITLLLLLNDPTAAIIFGIFFIVYQQIENNFISPVIQSKRLDLSPLVVLTAVTIGIYVFGLAGGIISIPIAGCIKVLVEEYLKRAKTIRQRRAKPLHKFIRKVHQAADDEA